MIRRRILMVVTAVGMFVTIAAAATGSAGRAGRGQAERASEGYGVQHREVSHIQAAEWAMDRCSEGMSSWSR